MCKRRQAKKKDYFSRNSLDASTSAAIPFTSPEPADPVNLKTKEKHMTATISPQMKEAFEGYAKSGAAPVRTYFQRAKRGIAELSLLSHHNGTKGESYIFEFKILEVTPYTTPGQAANEVGAVVGYVQKPGGGYFFKNTVPCVCALTGTDETDFVKAAEDSKFRKAQIAAKLIGEATPWSVDREFIAFLDNAAETGSLIGQKVQFWTNDPKEADGFIYPNFKAI